MSVLVVGYRGQCIWNDSMLTPRAALRFSPDASPLGYAKEDLDLYSFELNDAEMSTLSGKGKQIKSCEQGA